MSTSKGVLAAVRYRKPCAMCGPAKDGGKAPLCAALRATKAAEFAGLGSSCLAQMRRVWRRAALSCGKYAAKKLVRPLLQARRTHCGFTRANGYDTNFNGP
jgi:hypothetical protein